eukprot:CAMPEP_0113895912 /NCGR_PEP_ID=MMETSP0780_2-20120614/17670_1 /TAXON_ID=652834 /ORGANISM="Palpitomonas bilix" /LENGTH=88 /DNA_ID=CAMNT_0000886883 /DNA_START=163 /DNA_END=429 /DNA_ORIENTATION=+ /assembly_acc=CAM_ASM_000599
MFGFGAKLSATTRAYVGGAGILLAGAGLFLSDSTMKEESVSSNVAQFYEAKEQGECDCLPLWNCMQKGGECTQLEAELRACMARQKKQ